MVIGGKILGCRNKNKTNVGIYLVSGVFLNNYYWGCIGLNLG